MKDFVIKIKDLKFSYHKLYALWRFASFTRVLLQLLYLLEKVYFFLFIFIYFKI